MDILSGDPTLYLDCQIMDAGENLGPARKIQKLDPTVNHGESFSSTAW
jgi:hypothetical protein